MNKDLYRVVFNQARGMLMVVAEIARARCPGSPSSRPGRPRRSLTGKVSALSFSLWLALGAVQSVQADIVADGAAAKNRQPTIVAAANGTPQVNIQSPSKAGVSHNRFSRFDVDPRGVILNNATRHTSTNLAGMVAANPWLARGEAKVILNEVTSRDPSRLNGLIEVAGQKPQVIIASPAGITCDGCGFINASRTTLTTGQVQMADGHIRGYDVQRGEIVIDGRGMDSARADSTDLIARAVRVNAGLWAKELKVTTGRNQVDAAHQSVTVKPVGGSARPHFAVDVAQLGGMYARKIHLRGTEHGVGVHHAGVIGASAGDVVVNAEGTLINSGQIQARDQIRITSRSGITSRGVLAAGVNSDGSTAPTGDIQLTSEGGLQVSGQNQAPGRLIATGSALDFSASQSRAAQIDLTATGGGIRTVSARADAQRFTARTPGRLDNDGGNITADTLAVTARALSNRGGVLQQRGETSLTLAHQDGIDNRDGVIASAGEKLTLSGAFLDNQQGRVQASSLLISTPTASINNRQGVITARQEMVLQSHGLNNDAGQVQAGSALRLDLHGGALSNRDSGENGGLLSLGTLSLSAGALDNRSGYIAAAGDSQIGGLTLDNTRGTLYSESRLRLTTEALTNTRGLLQAGNNLTLDTRGQTLANDQGKISAGQDLALQTGTLTNQGGQIQSAGDLAIAAQTQLDNSTGLIRSGKTTTLTTRHLLNRDTARDNQGIEGHAVALTAPVLDNHDGAIRSTHSLIAHTLTLLDNSRGLLSSAGQLHINGGNSLALTNTGGTLIAGRELAVSAASASGDGKLLSQDAMQLTLQKAFTHTGEIIANGNITFTLAKGLTNESLIKAGGTLLLTAKNLTNRVNAEISAGENHLRIDGTLTNRGLLDGGLTHLTATTLNNYASGRIYGDHIALATPTLNNEAKNGAAPVIAARERLDIAATTLNNSGHALLYSADEMAIGGSLNAQYQAEGQAQTLNNTGATVESGGNMFLSIATINNRNAGMKTRVAVVEKSSHHEASLAGSEKRFDWADVYVGDKNKWDVHQATMPDGSKGREFYEYSYKRVVKETQVTATDPGKIIAGGDLRFNSQQVNNQDSRIVAGGLLGGTIGELNNLATTGVRITTDTGTQTRWYAKKSKTTRGTTRTSQGRKRSDYTPAPVTQTIDLKQMAWLSQTREISSTAIASRNTGGMTTATAHTGTASPGQVMTVGNGENSVIRLTPPDLRLPDNSLYTLRLTPDVPYLIETDPRFTRQRTWLSSDYMQRQFSLDGNNMLKRLGDGFYEQRLIREQIIRLTGNRYLQGFSNDETQFRALMDAGVAFGHRYSLTPGVALTAAQMALLTSDMVWLVQQDVRLADGRTQQVLVPQVYARVQPGDPDGSGALLSGKNIALALGQDLTNSGSIRGREVTQITAGSLHNSGVIGGKNVSLTARADIHNTGGTLQGDDRLSLTAGRDITSTTTTRGDDANRWIDRPAALFVQNDGGELSLQALNNITLSGSQVSNAGAGGRTRIAAGNDLNLTTVNTARTEYGNWGKGNSRLLAQSAQVGSQINGGGDMVLQAGHNLTARAASVTAKEDLILTARNDISISAGKTTTHEQSSGRKTSATYASVAHQGSALSTGGDLILNAGRDVTLKTTTLLAEDNVGILASRDVNLLAEADTEHASSREKKRKEISESVRQQGVKIASGGDTNVVAGRDIAMQAAETVTKGDIALSAGRDVNLTTAMESDYHYLEKKKTKKRLLSKKTTHTIEEDSATREKGTLLSGNHIAVSAGNNLLVKGSALAGDGDIQLRAGNNVDIVAGTRTDTSWRFKETKKSGLMGTGGIGFSIGSSKTTHDLREQGTTRSQSFSTVGSTGGNISISAGKQLHIGGADVIARRDIQLSGDQVVIDPGQDHRTRDERFEQKSSGLTLALSGAAGSAINSAVQTAQQAKGESDSRLATLQATKAALSGVQAAQGVAVAQATGDPNNGIGVSISLTSQKSRSEQHAESNTVAGSTLNAGGNLAITATGSDILIRGSQLKAAGDTTLRAANDIVLSGAASTQKTTGKNSSSGGGVGVSIGGGTSGYGISVFASVNAAKGKEKGDGTAWTETTVDSGGTVSLTSGRDTLLNGAQVSGNKIVADIGRDLWIQSQQDSNDYSAKQNSVAAGGSFTFGSMTGSGYISASQDRMKSNYDSVQEQTGLFAGSGGFDVTVERNTQLDGGVMASTATAEKNRLETGTLGFSDIRNEADYKVSHSGASFSGGGSFGDTFKGNMAGGMITAAGNSGHAQGTTRAAVADGTLLLRDPTAQTQDVAALSRDTQQANGSISPIFDKAREQKRLQTISLVGDIAGQAADIARTQGEINALKEARKANPDMPLDKLKETKKYKEEQAKYGTGSDIQRGIQAATAALQGLAGGDIGAALAGASAPELAHLLKSTEGNTAVNALAHAILGGAVAALQGNSVAAGATGAAAGELAARAITSMLYPGVDDLTTLSEEQKQTISMLSTISAGIAGGLAGDSTAVAATGAQAGKTAVENNFLSVNQLDGFVQRARNCTGNSCEKVVRDMINLNIKQQQEIAALCSTNPQQCQQKYGYLVEQWEVFDATIKRMAADGTLPKDFRFALAPVYTLSMEAEGIMATQGWTERFESMGFNKEVAGAMAATLPLAMSGAKGAKGTTGATAGNRVINPATNKVATDHTVVLSGKAPKTSTPNSIYEVSRVDGTKSITYYDDKGRMFSREDYGQQKTHGQLGYDSNGKVPPHEHKFTYNERGYADKKYYREVDKDGKSVGPWIEDKK